jgi:hypothetical protein
MDSESSRGQDHGVVYSGKIFGENQEQRQGSS